MSAPGTVRSNLLLICAGAFTMAAQTLALREHLVLYGGNELGVGVFFAAWLAWIAVGAGLALIWPGLRSLLSRRFNWLLLAYVPALVVQLLLLRWLPGIVGGEGFSALPIGALLGWTVLLDAPVSLVTGLVFPAAGARARAEAEHAPRTVGRLYALEAAGAFAGGLAITGLTAATVPALDIALGAGIVVALFVALDAWPGRDWRAVAAALAVAATLASLVLTPAGGGLRRAADAVRDDAVLPGTTLIEAVETPYQHAAVFQRGEQRVLTLGGRVAAAFPETRRPERVAALALGQLPRPGRALLAGAGALSLARLLLDLNTPHVTVLCPGNANDEHVAGLLRAHVGGAEGEALSDSRLRFLAHDLRRFLEGELTNAPPWDLVVLDLPDPENAGGGRYATEEALRVLATRLAPGGLLAYRARSGANVLSPAQAAYGGSVLATLSSVFPDVAVFPGEETWFLATPRAGLLLREPAALARRFAAEAFDPERLPAELFHNVVEPARMSEARAAFETGGAEINRDARPGAFFHNLLIWVEQNSARLVDVLRALRSAGLWLVLVPLLVGLVLRAHRATTRGRSRATRRRWNAGALMAALGGAGIALQLVVLLSFEARVGGLFWLAGLLNALFMAGLAGGGLVGSLLVTRVGDERRDALALATGALAATLAAALPLLLNLVSDAGVVGYAALALVLGVVLGAGFPAAGLLGGEGREAGALGAVLALADHWGAAAGAAVVGLLLVPLLGLGATCVVAGAALSLPVLLIAGEMLAARYAPGHGGILGTWRARRRHPSLPFDTLRYGVLFVAATVGILGAVVGPRLNPPRLAVAETELRTVLRADATQPRTAPFRHVLALEEPSGDCVGAGATSAAVAPDVEGYGGRLNVQVIVDARGRLAGLRLIESNETPAYLHGLAPWLAALQGRDPAEPLRLDEDVDGLTGATVTGRAVLEATRRTGRALVLEALGREVPADAPETVRWSPTAWYVALAFLLAVPVALGAGPWTRRAFLALNVVFGGFVFNALLSSEHVAALAQGRLPGTGDIAGWLLVVGALALGVLLGPVYCALLCPLGALQELVGDATGARPPSPRLYRRVRALKYGVLALLVVTGAFGLRWLDVVDPLVQSFSFDWTWVAAALLVVILGASALFPRFWCRALCPVGALLNLTNALSLLRFLRRPRLPMKCDMGTTRTHDLDCLQCNRCLYRNGANRT